MNFAVSVALVFELVAETVVDIAVSPAGMAGCRMSVSDRIAVAAARIFHVVVAVAPRTCYVSGASAGFPIHPGHDHHSHLRSIATGSFR